MENDPTDTDDIPFSLPTRVFITAALFAFVFGAPWFYGVFYTPRFDADTNLLSILLSPPAVLALLPIQLYSAGCAIAALHFPSLWKKVRGIRTGIVGGVFLSAYFVLLSIPLAFELVRFSPWLLCNFCACFAGGCLAPITLSKRSVHNGPFLLASRVIVGSVAAVAVCVALAMGIRLSAHFWDNLVFWSAFHAVLCAPAWSLVSFIYLAQDATRVRLQNRDRTLELCGLALYFSFLAGSIVVSFLAHLGAILPEPWMN